MPLPADEAPGREPVEQSGDLAGFCARQLPALLADQIRHTILISMLERAAAAETSTSQLAVWSLGAPGQCAVTAPLRPMVLANLDRQQCRAMARATPHLTYSGVLGPDDTALWFAEEAASLGVAFAPPMRQRILALAVTPRPSSTGGAARLATAADASLVADWIEGFLREALPHDPIPSRESLEQRAGDRDLTLWEVGGRPVSMATIVRRTRDAGAISSVYTPPAERGRGYAGAVTAAVAARIFAEGRAAVCLYTDASNPHANRCYERIGFRQHCAAAFVSRQPTPAPGPGRPAAS